MKKFKGFTLIELVIVIVVLGILAAIALPKFINIKSDAQAGVVSGTGAAFKSGISLAHSKWAVGGNSGPVDNLDLYDNGTDLMDMNEFGWPAQSWFPFEASPTLNNTDDCISVWETVLEVESPTVATDTTEDYQVTYTAATCTFTYVAEPAFSIFYDSNNGEVIIDVTL